MAIFLYSEIESWWEFELNYALQIDCFWIRGYLKLTCIWSFFIFLDIVPKNDIKWTQDGQAVLELATKINRQNTDRNWLTPVFQELWHSEIESFSHIVMTICISYSVELGEMLYAAYCMLNQRNTCEAEWLLFNLISRIRILIDIKLLKGSK